MADIDQYVTLAEAARILRRSKSTVARYTRLGLLPAVRKGVQTLVQADSLSQFQHPKRGNPNLNRR